MGWGGRLPFYYHLSLSLSFFNVSVSPAHSYMYKNKTVSIVCALCSKAPAPAWPHWPSHLFSYPDWDLAEMRLADMGIKYLIKPAMAVCECADACGILHFYIREWKHINVDHHLQYIILLCLFFLYKFDVKEKCCLYLQQLTYKIFEHLCLELLLAVYGLYI